METAVSNKVRNISGKFAPKSETPRKIRSVNLTDDAWQWLAAVAEKAGVSRNDYLEALAEGSSPFIEMVEPQAQPLMETVETDREVDEVNIEKQPETEFYPFIETVLTEVESLKLELEAVRAENQLLQIELGNSEVKVETLNQESQLKTERASREQIKNLAPIAIGVELPEPADLLNQLKAKRKKSTATLTDVEKILEILEGER